MIVKNEEPVLKRCLSCASRFADELIVVDTGSTDRSIEIAKKFTPYVYSHPWQNSFAEARNYSYSKAAGDYIMWLDADDVVTGKNIARLNALKAEETDADVIFTVYTEYAESGLTFSSLRNRIIKRSVFKGWQFDVHESIPLAPEWKQITRTDIEILHKKEHVNEPERNMDIFHQRLETDKPLEPYEKATLIMEYSLRGETEEALSLFRELFSSDTSDSNLLFAFSYLSDALMCAKRWEDCLNIIEDMEKNVAPTAKTIFAKARCVYALGDEKQAEALYRSAIATEDDILEHGFLLTGYNDYYPYLRLAWIMEKRGKTREALRLLKRAGKAHSKAEEWKKLRRIIIADSVSSAIRSRR